MEYLDFISKWEPQRPAIYVDDTCYTYGNLRDMAVQMRKTKKGEGWFYPITEREVLEQLVHFLAFSGTQWIPVMVDEQHEEQLEKLSEIEKQEIPPDSCMAVFTSGTTGNAKLLYRSFQSWADYFPIQNQIFHIDENTAIFMHGSLYFTGNLNLYLSVLSAGGAIHTVSQFAPDKWKSCIQERCNMIYLVPSKLNALKRVYKNKLEERKNKIKMILSGSWSLGRQEAEALREIFPHTDVLLYYGASELNYITYVTFDNMTQDKNLIGKPFPQVKVSLKDGEIFVDTAYGVQGLSMPCSIGDCGEMDEMGNYYFLGRKDERYSIHEEKVFAAVIERALCQIDGIREAAVVYRQEQLQAHLVSDRKWERKELIKQLSTVLRPVEIPKQFIYHEALEKNHSGKINKNQL